MNSEHWQELRTFLTEKKATGVESIQLPQLRAETSLTRGESLAVLSILSDEGVLKPVVEVRCPYCDTHHGEYESKSDVPSKLKNCITCNEQIDLNSQTNWAVVYKIEGELSDDFFRSVKERLKTFVDSASSLPSNYFQREYQRLESLDGVADESERGRLFDYFIGLLFIQIDGVTATVKKNEPRGEVDVMIDCIDAPDWLRQLVGNVALIENKWEAEAVGQSEIVNFHSKAENISLRTTSNLSYFISMSGFTEGAVNELRESTSPNIIPFDREEVIEMIECGSPETHLRDNPV